MTRRGSGGATRSATVAARWSRPAMIAAVVVAGAGSLLLALTHPLDRDESMYLAAGTLLDQGRLYADVPFFQPPYAAWVHGAWQRLVPGDHVLLEGRLLAALVALALAVAVLRLWRRLGAPGWAAALLLVILWQQAAVQATLGLARNHDLALLAVVGALLALPRLVGRDAGPAAGARPGPSAGAPAGPMASRRRLLAAGVLAGVAVGLKLTHAPLAALVVAWPLVITGRGGPVAWTAAGAALGLLPAAVSLVGVDLAAVRFFLLDYHQLNADWHRAEGLGRGVDLAGKLDHAGAFARETGHAVLLVCAVMGAASAAWGAWAAGAHRRRRGTSSGASAGPRSGLAPGSLAGWASCLAPGAAWRLVAGLLAAGLLMVAVPSPVQTGYHVPLLLALATVPAVALGRAPQGSPEDSPRGSPRGSAPRPHRSRVLLGALLAVAALVAVVHRAPETADRWRVLRHLDRWPPLAVHAAGIHLAALTAEHPARPVVTTAPVLALEAGRRPLRGLAAGPFAWRLGARLPAQRARSLGLVTPQTLAATLAATPPAAVAVRRDGPWDGPLAGWARRAGWSVDRTLAGISVWTELR